MSPSAAMPSSAGHVSSMSTTTRDISDQRTISGLRDVARIVGGNSTLASKSTLSFQSFAHASTLGVRGSGCWLPRLFLTLPNEASFERLSCRFHKGCWLFLIEVRYQACDAQFDVLQDGVMAPGVPLVL